MVVKQQVWIKDIYGFDVYEATITGVADRLIPELKEWQQRPLDATIHLFDSMPSTTTSSPSIIEENPYHLLQLGMHFSDIDKLAPNKGLQPTTKKGAL